MERDGRYGKLTIFVCFVPSTYTHTHTHTHSGTLSLYYFLLLNYFPLWSLGKEEYILLRTETMNGFHIIFFRFWCTMQQSLC